MSLSEAIIRGRNSVSTKVVKLWRLDDFFKDFWNSECECKDTEICFFVPWRQLLWGTQLRDFQPKRQGWQNHQRYGICSFWIIIQAALNFMSWYDISPQRHLYNIFKNFLQSSICHTVIFRVNKRFFFKAWENLS